MPGNASRERRLQRRKAEAYTGLAVTMLTLVGLIALLSHCMSSDGDTKSPEAIAAEAKTAAENRRKGFHCLSAWDGSNSSLVRQVKAGLRDPGSFEHIETRITPVNERTGKHSVSMAFRARNGFGGMNVERAIANVDPSTCEASVILVGN